jgi:hypothetical protein
MLRLRITKYSRNKDNKIRKICKKIIADNSVYIRGKCKLREEIIKNVMGKLHKITTREPNIFDKFLGMYYGDNCTLIIIFNKNN